MRVISGSKKGMPLLAVPGKGTRPTVDKVKESIFSMIGPYFNGGIALDLYAGTGGLGIEALSRGMDKVIFVDMDRKALDVIKTNLERTHFTDQAEVYKNEASRALKALIKREELKLDLVFLDPPYAYQKIESEIAILHDHGVLSPNAFIVAETDVEYQLSDQIGQVVKRKEVEYGNTRITVFQFREAGREGDEES
ncbi:16S rRNA (guanine(966)-N(2))-methyltransferase RsmD [Ammoniphilus sp. CFH 90114]|uniref:16S rRNA (guanine(966)-N(2))-methyltransferase RsmD n=1 Tax=Ammoniphilus sp. CFH 90114 TaxID=2493665 RepID=UPI00100EEC17|nr:16S rRNA (guanine(966)-N(2))-methyltransferase RsmD [Ammoniphilus sp. CFH 90114]RXT15066.1 16S rRNA (guanine(966)-N(2))-methyltransferase RsmD [Ammoniphilus sp. CFH 90114]